MCPSLNNHFGEGDGDILIGMSLDFGVENNPRLNLLAENERMKVGSPKEIQSQSQKGCWSVNPRCPYRYQGRILT